MATAAEHEKQAEHNEQFLATIDNARFPDWATTVIFYAAVHQAQMLIESQGGKGGNHHNRNKTLRTQYLSVWKHYMPIYEFSRLARYRCMRIKPEHVPYVERRYRRLVEAISDAMP